MNSLQLNIGIIAACASFLKPLVGRILKINSSAAYYPTYPQYNRSGRTPLGTLDTNVGNNMRTGMPDQSPRHDRDLPAKGDTRQTQYELSSLGRKDQMPRSQVTSGEHSSSEAIYTYELPSDSNSEELILQQQDGTNGIIRTRQFTVQYSNASVTNN